MKLLYMLCGISTLASVAPAALPDADEAAYPAIEQFVEVIEVVRKRHPDRDRLAYERLVHRHRS